MPDITLEILSIVLVLFVILLTSLSSGIDKSNRLHALFTKIEWLGGINLVIEIFANYIIYDANEYGPMTLIAVMELYYISLLAFLFLSIIYTIRMTNQQLPSLKRIGNWLKYTVTGLMAVMLVLPFFLIKFENYSITYGKKIYFIFYVWFVIEILMGLSIGSKVMYINYKQRQIMGLSFASRVLLVIIQMKNMDVFIMSIVVASMLMSYYMTLENDDVLLIEQLAVEKEKADEANKSKSSFIANVSHEIRTPINAILGMDEIILRETKDKQIRQYAMDIKSATQILYSIVNEILDLSKIESGKMELVPVNYNMRSLINDTVNIIQIKMDSKDLKFNVDVDASLPAGYHGDEVRIKQILSNILSNAVKYTNEGSVSLTITGEKLLDGKELLKFKIEDTGIGMTKENLDSLFDKFARFDYEKNRNVEGTGLGMSITNQFLHMMGSDLKVESEYGKGSVFSFELEQDIWDETPLGDFRKVNKSTADNYVHETTIIEPEKRVLVVDDNAINRKVFKGLLKNTELIIDEAESGPESINMVRKNKYDLIFMDHMMPDMDGIETFHKMKELPDNMSIDAPVVMLTANAVMGAQEVYISEGFDDFLPKPIIPEKLEEMIKKYI